ncbi:D-alanyl-D-alanine carboxypeptidase/D-alanyl-D-alanine endopeptidase [Microbacterium sp. A93]|uniref:D-alanyl-D-alanine carboxypeptidase/D-alanyl-D-alanine endopeptidase n=1 Tax=Microbacterium sp. A93 TaxID=3450716 RepID=UPI003F4392C0
MAAVSAALTLAEFVNFPDLSPLLVPSPDPETLAPLLDEALALHSGTMSAAVRDSLTGELLYSEGPDQPVVPASAVKILTAAAALHTLGPDHRYTTAAVARPLGEGRTAVVLDAGGDVMLGTGENAEDANGRAGLGTLAEQTAQALKDQGAVGTVAVGVDDSGYGGPGESPDWSPDIVSSGNASTVQPIATYGGRAYPGRDTNRLHDPAVFAAEVFRNELAARAEALGLDLEVEAEVDRAALTGDGTVLAEVESAPLSEQMTYMLRTSDNQVAEATGRNLALEAGEDGSFEGASQAIKDALADLGVDTEGLSLVDASGLSEANRVSAAQLTATLQVASTSPDLETVVTGLPAAGEEGTLQDRMVGTAAVDAVRAKTGTLSSVASLTGTVQTEDGRTLLFSFIANGQPGVLDNARFAVDRAAVVLAGCGCR